MSEMNVFLWYSYFGIIFEEAEEDLEKALEACMQRAYRDLCRTLKYSISESVLKNKKKEYADTYRKKKKKFVEEEKEYIAGRIEDLFEQILKGAWNFDAWHETTCEKIEDKAQEQEVVNDFSYGQAQKWLNMTLKYMLLMKLWDDPMKEIEGSDEPLHIPVDAYVIEAVKNYVKLSGGKKWECLKKSKKGYEESWSKWGSAQYKEFQKNMRDLIDGQEGEEEQKYSTPMNWEQKKWIEIAKNKSEK